MMRFDSAISSFIALLVNKPYKKTEKGKIKKKFQLRSKKFTTIFVSKVLSGNPSPRLKEFCWPVMDVKLRKRKF